VECERWSRLLLPVPVVTISYFSVMLFATLRGVKGADPSPRRKSAGGRATNQVHPQNTLQVDLVPVPVDFVQARVRVRFVRQQTRFFNKRIPRECGGSATGGDMTGLTETPRRRSQILLRGEFQFSSARSEIVSKFHSLLTRVIEQNPIWRENSFHLVSISISEICILLAV
jgi:hypothetical protein